MAVTNDLLEQLDSKDGIMRRYAWPGGYPLYALMQDGGALCVDCVNSEIKLVIDSTLADERDGWSVETVTVNWEDAELYCDHCNQLIESAYGEVAK